MSRSEKKERAKATIREMGLQDAMNRRIGGRSVQGLSGGQKRRVSICIEILKRPKLLFLDEPTSGLDSAASYHVMNRIVQLAKQDGRTVVASIHQPSREVFELFHNIYLLSSGRTVYTGSISAANEDLRHSPGVPSSNRLECVRSCSCFRQDIGSYVLEISQTVVRWLKQIAIYNNCLKMVDVGITCERLRYLKTRTILIKDGERRLKVCEASSPQDPINFDQRRGRRLKLAEMVHFRDYKSPSSKNKYLLIEADDGTVLTRLLTETPTTGKYADPWPPLQNFLHMSDWTSEHDIDANRLIKVWTLRTSNQCQLNIASTLPCIGRRILKGDIRWGNTMEVTGEYRHTQRYWEWAEDILAGSAQTLKAAKIYNIVYASLFTYDRNSNILQAFFEACCPTINTLLTSAGELSISVWDLYKIGGLPIRGLPYEEVVPKAMELTGVDEKHERFIPCSCELLFVAFQLLQEGEAFNLRVPLSKWIKFWCKRILRYDSALLRKEKKSARLKSTHNLTGTIPKAAKWLSLDDGTFRVAAMMVNKQTFSLAVPVLSNIYNGLNRFYKSPQLEQLKVSFPIHYVYGWIAYYFKTHFLLSNGPSIPLMMAYSGEGGERYFDGERTRKRIHQGDSAVWTSTMLSKSNPCYFVDDDKDDESETSYFMSLCFNLLPFRYGVSFILEPYSPHRFSRQFGFYQGLPKTLKDDIRSASLYEGLRFYRICVSHGSMSKAIFPKAISNTRRHSSTQYKSWWDKVHGNFLEVNLQSLVTAAGPIINTPQEHGKEVPTVVKPPILKSKVKGSLYTATQKEESPVLAQQAFNKRPPQDKSESSHGDRCWKKARQTMSKFLEDPHQSKPQDSSESVLGPDSRELLLSSKEVTSNSCGKVKANMESNFSRQPTVTMSIFYGKKVVSELKKKFIMKAWANIPPLQDLLGSFFRMATSYNQARSAFVDKITTIKESKPYLKVKEHLELVLRKRDEKSEEVSVACISLEKARKKVKKLKACRDAAKQEVTEMEFKVSADKEEFSKCSDVSLATVKASKVVEKKKQVLKAALQDLINYKLYLD
ncbi:ABC transporter G family member 11 [Capsicum chinense]|nr:ABC transporter G family member 11 [Capsicum chinense]